MSIGINEIVLLATTIAGLFTSLFYSRKAKRAEVHKQEIENADAMVNLIKKANEEAAALQKKMMGELRAEYERIINVCAEQKNLNKELKHENEKFRKTAEKLERALNGIPRCPYRDNCPVLDELQDWENCNGIRGSRKNDGRYPGDIPGHSDRITSGQRTNQSTTGM